MDQRYSPRDNCARISIVFDVCAPESATWHEADRQLKERIQVSCETAEAEELRHPVSFQMAHQIMGLLLGTLPPAAIFMKILGYGVFTDSPIVTYNSWWIVPMFLAMNVICAVVGYFMGGHVGDWLLRNRPQHSIMMAESDEPVSWPRFLFRLPLFAALWGLITGIAGGLPVGIAGGIICGIEGGLTPGVFGAFYFFVFGAFFGAIFAIPIGTLSITSFGLLHRLLAPRGTIELRSFLPLAIGINLVISGLIMGVSYAGFR